ncbi:hypothetical protein FX988_00695 [Paraglaciecola mesophila]|uniref:D-lactate dehydrogenase (cytochrome) n=1 Tax=Paraglaciecola mesophila TaxID=197222 RepID=A0A857JHP6_9ALTE|nr:FAD-binding and (Fe-S)-binding domain-containing protein [Paraglaciecola mesophila]QHJ10481.1 hypothetical protein FX988_00695 [Paraglaciecola mesophila]
MTRLPSDYLHEVSHFLPSSAVIQDISRRRALAVDASFYQLIPQLVLKLSCIEQLQTILKLSQKYQVAVTFRAAGTSLSGQGVTDSVLVILTDDWRKYAVLNDGQQVKLQPGIIGAQANKILAPYGRKIGPDPASINSCKIGGIAANNASGMCCGVAHNSYYTVQDMTIVLADGCVVDTSDEGSVAAFCRSHAMLLSELEALALACQRNQALRERIEHKYRLKNTCGYALNALIDYQDPLQILMHLMIGSEGTLGFIADITYNTVIEHEYKASGLYLFATAEQACGLVTALSLQNVDAVELMDQRALNSVKGQPGLPDSFCTDNDNYTALLIETSADSEDALKQNIRSIERCIGHDSALHTISLSDNKILNQQLWAIRKGTFPAVGAVRETGTTVIIEDVCFPIANMAEGIQGLHRLFDEFGYSEGIIFGHALAGNLHFVFTQGFDEQREIERYDQFMQAVAHLVAVEFNGSLKAEHGTGRNMAPFVPLEWGSDAYEVMRKIKQIIDPVGILNPGVILNDDPQSHIKNLKLMPEANEIVDKCIECGFCEAVCPSQDLSYTPRQRIAIWRRIKQLRRAQSASNSTTDTAQLELQQLEHDFQYMGVDTCAATGLCAQRCPVGINTGDLIRQLRSENQSKFGKTIAKFSAEHFSLVSKGAGLGLALSSTATKLLGAAKADKVGVEMHRVSAKKLPLWHSQWPSRGKAIKIDGSVNSKQIIYFASCASRNMGPAPSDGEQRSTFEAARSIFNKAGYQLILPERLDELCCGMPFSSKGFPDLAIQKGQELVQQLQDISQGGKIPIVFDTSPCKQQINALKSTQGLPIYETSEFMVKHVIGDLDITRQQEPVALHITCSSRKMGLAGHLQTLAHACSETVIEPNGIECCGFAGDKGFFMPELNRSALRHLQAQIPADCKAGYSNSRTCEIGLSHHSGIPYRSLLLLLDDVSTKKATKRHTSM